VGARLPVRRHRHRENYQDPARRRRVHPLVPRGSPRALHRGGCHRRYARQYRWAPVAGTRSSSAVTMAANSLRVWCCFAGTSHIESGSTWEHSEVEAHASRIHDEIAGHRAVRLLEAHVLIAGWRSESNTSAFLGPRHNRTRRVRGTEETDQASTGLGAGDQSTDTVIATSTGTRPSQRPSLTKELT
jgi:hypothetical protein